MRPLFVTGVSLWAPGFSSLAAFMQGAFDPAIDDAACAWVPSRLLRGSSRLTRMFGEAAAQACAAAGRDPKEIAGTLAPRIASTAIDSATSFCGVAVPCAMSRPTSAGTRSACARARVIASLAPRPEGSGEDML